jgi:hypothetical protein
MSLFDPGGGGVYSVTLEDIIKSVTNIVSVEDLSDFLGLVRVILYY